MLIIFTDKEQKSTVFKDDVTPQVRLYTFELQSTALVNDFRF